MRIIMLIYLVFLTTQVDAQQDRLEKQFGLGLVVGFNVAQLNGDQLRGYDKIGANIGVQSSYFLGESSSLRLEILFSQKGSTKELQLGVPSDGFDIQLNYMEIPVFYNYEIEPVGFHVGLSYARLVAAKSDETLTGYDPSDFRDDDFNVLVGTSYRFLSNWGVDVRYTRSMVNLYDSPNGNKNGLNNYMLSLRLNYSFK